MKSQWGYCRKSSKKNAAELKEVDGETRAEICSRPSSAEKVPGYSRHRQGAGARGPGGQGANLMSRAPQLRFCVPPEPQSAGKSATFTGDIVSSPVPVTGTHLVISVCFCVANRRESSSL